MYHSRTYVMGYWPIADNPKNSLEHYSKYVTHSFDMLSGQRLLFLSNRTDILKNVAQAAKKRGIDCEVRQIDFADFEKFSQIGKMVEQTAKYGRDLSVRPKEFNNEKGLVHFWRDFVGSDPATYIKMLCIWQSKIDLLSKVAIDNPFNTKEFAWIDATISRFNGKRHRWRFTDIDYDNKFGEIYHYRSKMCKHGKPIAMNASFILGDETAVKKLKSLFDTAFGAALSEAYPNDEETILDSVVQANPKLFYTIDHQDAVFTQQTEQPPNIAAQKVPQELSEMTKSFDAVYEKGLWRGGEGSGPGSELSNCLPMCFQLANFINTHKIEKIADVSCGGMAWWPTVLSLVNHKVQFYGFDVSSVAIRRNRVKFAGYANMAFSVADARKVQLPKCDLVVCRETINHLSVSNAKAVIENLQAADTRYVCFSDEDLVEKNVVEDNKRHNKKGADEHVFVYSRWNLRLDPFFLPEPDHTIREFNGRCMQFYRIE